MKNKYNKRKYKMQFGVQRVEMDTPDYGSAYAIRQKQNATSQMTGNLISGALNMAVPGAGSAVQGLSAISDAAFKDAKGNYKSKGAEMANFALNPLATAGKAVSALTGDKTAAADLWSGNPLTYGAEKLFGIKNPFGKTTQEKVKEEAMKQKDITKMANINKRYSEATATDAQSYLAKRGKYKVKSKQPRLIETEGREPIFSPKKADGTRDLLYYNPNDPTHEEGGVKAVVMPRRSKESLLPKAQKGKRTTKSQTDDNEDKESYFENIAEIIDPTGLTSWGDAYRAIKSAKNNPNKESIVNAALETLGVVPFAGKLKFIGKLGRSFEAGKFAARGKNVFTDILPGMLNDEGFNYQKGTYGGRSIFPQFTQTYKDMIKAYGAKQVKVNDLNTTALSQNLGGMPAVNAANKFIQPMAGKMQVARQIPEYRRKATIKNPMSHKKENPDTNRIVDPPTPIEMRDPITPSGFNKKTLYEAKLPKPVSTHNTKNDYNKGSKRVKVYR